MAKKDYSNLTKDQLLEVIEKLEGKKKYGLVWDEERVPEKVVTDCQDKLPVLTEVKGKEIITDENEPTHILIEGDNYHALSVLNYTHKGKIDLIYIDPPYNTGNKDFIYNDKYVEKEDTWRHSKWLTFMSKRLELAKDLLTEKGVIFISIDDNEQAQLKLLCDSIFGENNFTGSIIIETATDNNPRQISIEHEYLTCYCKNSSSQEKWIGINYGAIKIQNEYERLKALYKADISKIQIELRKFIKDNKDNLSKVKHYSFVDNLGVYYPDNPSNTKLGGYEFEVLHPITGKVCALPTNGFRFPEKTFYEMLSNGNIEFGKDETIIPKPKRRLSNVKELLRSIYYEDGRVATGNLINILGSKLFNNPKSTNLIEHFISFIPNNQNFTILDFFAGSGTTGHAILNLNNKDNGKRKFIICTNNENEICENVTYPRVLKAIQGYNNLKGELIKGLGNNLKYFKTSFVANNRNKDQLKIDITKRCTEMLCLKEGIFNLIKEEADYKIFQQGNRYLAVYYDFANASLDELKEEMNALKGEKVLYCFTVDNHGLDKANFRGWKNIRLEPIPQKILDVYKRIFKN